MAEINIEKIIDLLPHRYPFLLIDKVTDYVPFEKIYGIKNVTVNEPQFTGHFPGLPIMPGVLMVEAMAQLAGLLIAASVEQDSSKKQIIYFLGIEQAKFRKVVKPGDTLKMSAKIIQNRKNVWRFETACEVDGIVVTEAVLSAMVKDRD